MNSRTKCHLAAVATTLVLLGQSRAAGLEDWLLAHLKASTGKKLPVQTQSISVDHGSTAFVDQSSGADLVSTALNLTPVGSGSSSQNGSGTVTASLYSVYALAARQDPLTPSVYNRHSSFLLREVNVTFGREQPDTSGGQATPAGTIYGAKWMIVNYRDASKVLDKSTDDKVKAVLAGHASAKAAAIKELADVLSSLVPTGTRSTDFINSLDTTDKIDTAIAKLSPANRAGIDQVVRDYEAAIQRAGDLNGLVLALQRRPQISLDFQTIQRVQSLSDDYRLQFIYDQGLADRWSATFNGSYDYSNSHKIGGDVRSGRGAFEFRYSITQVSGFSLRSPMALALSGEGVRKEGEWDYRAQLQLSIPIASGVNLPFSFGYGNQKSVLMQQEKGVYGKFGITLDLAKAVDALKNAH